MMVVRGDSNIDGQSLVRVIHPADRCTWTQAYDSANKMYGIANAFFYIGAIDADSTDVRTGITNPVLGVIGKSGRFVAITES